MFVRVARDEELDVVAERMGATLVEVLGAQRAQAMYSPEWLRSRARELAEAGCVFVCDDGPLLGHTILRVEGTLGLFSTTWVDPAARRRGVADLLLDHGERWLMAQGVEQLGTNTSSTNTPLLRLYERRGYRITTRSDEMVQLTRPVEGRAATLARWAPALAYRVTPDSVVTERSGWFQIRTPGGTTGQNEVLFGVPDDVDAVIAEYTDPMKWCVMDPALEAVLQARGFRFWGARAMVAPTSGVEAKHRVEVVTPELELACARVYAQGWGGSLEMNLERVRASSTRHVLAFLDGEPVGAAGVHIQPGVDYLMGAIVLPHARGSGLYKALLAGRLEVAEGLALTHARDATSAPILERLGFETLFVYRCGTNAAD